MEESHIDPELLSFLHEASEEDLHALVELHEDLTNDDEIELYIYLCFLIFRRSHNIQYLRQALQRAMRRVLAMAISHPDFDRRVMIINALLLWDPQDEALKEEIRCALTPIYLNREESETEKPTFLRRYTEAMGLFESFERMGSFECLNKAIKNIELEISILGEYSPPPLLSNFGMMLGRRSGLTGSMDDLNRAISFTSESINAAGSDHTERATLLFDFAVLLDMRSSRTRSLDDLNQAISIMNGIIHVTLQDDPVRRELLNNLGLFLGHRFERTGLIDDLHQAIGVLSEAVDAIPFDHPDRVLSSNALGMWLGKRYTRIGSINDLNRAISLFSEAVNAVPHYHPDRIDPLHNLAVALEERYNRMESINDLNQAISLMNEGFNATPHNYVQRTRYVTLNNLGSLYHLAYKQTKSSDDLDQIIRLYGEAANATPHDHPDRAHSIFELGRALGARSAITKSQDDAKRMLESYIASWRSHTAAMVMTTQGPISLLPTLVHFSGLASMAATAALRVGKAPEHALQLLELGRGVIASLLMDMRGDITDLRQKFPELAEKFTSLRDELDLPAQDALFRNSTNTKSSWELQMKRRREVDEEFNNVIDIIRAQPGFFNFLRPPAAEELMSTAEQGPIIILNLNLFHGDAFLIQRGSIQVIELPGLNLQVVEDKVTSLSTNSEISPLLEWLWHTICRPCLDALEIKDVISDDNWPHIWWIPTGLLSQLPLHAAGIYKQGSKETVLDRAISSYASSIKALLHGRKHSIRQPSSEDLALMVAMQETPGLERRGCLPFASDEVHILKDFCPLLQLAPIMPLQRKKDILEYLPKCKLFHFAGHGQSNSKDPSQSCLLLEDWETNPLSVGEVRDSQLQNNPPFLAYLSACSTGANKATELIDEGIHLISAFQLAGFRHVIGTLWEVSDKHCVDVARILYKTLEEEGMTDMAVSRGLHRAVRALRSGDAEDMQARDAKLACPRPASQGVTDFFWVPYVHFGV
ncbi:CHAT domain-containing protein [Trichoderma austrokoningii]